MINLQNFFLNFADLVRRWKERGIEEKQILSVKDKLIEQREIKNNINQLRKRRNELSRAGPKNAEQVIELKKEISQTEKGLETLSAKIHDLISQLPNLP